MQPVLTSTIGPGERHGLGFTDVGSGALRVCFRGHDVRSTAELTAHGYTCRTALIVELDMPLRRYADHRAVLLARLYDLRRQGRAVFTGLRFEVHVLIAQRANDEGDH